MESEQKSKENMKSFSFKEEDLNLKAPKRKASFLVADLIAEDHERKTKAVCEDEGHSEKVTVNTEDVLDKTFTGFTNKG